MKILFIIKNNIFHALIAEDASGKKTLIDFALFIPYILTQSSEKCHFNNYFGLISKWPKLEGQSFLIFLESL